MDIDNLINQIGNQTYEDFLEKNAIEGEYSIDEDSLDYFKMSIGDDDLIFEFERGSNLLFSVEVNDLSGKVFSLPKQFEGMLSRSQVQSYFGEPIHSVAPRKILRIQTGWIDQFYWSHGKKMSVLVYYSYESDIIDCLTFLPTEGVHWGKQSPN